MSGWCNWAEGGACVKWERWRQEELKMPEREHREMRRGQLIRGPGSEEWSWIEKGRHHFEASGGETFQEKLSVGGGREGVGHRGGGGG